MKKMFLIVVLLAAYVSSFADGSMFYLSAQQTNWRWRNNDGSEIAATWQAAQNAPTNYTGKEIVRLRVEIVNLSSHKCGPDGCPIGDPAHFDDIDVNDSLQYSTTPSDASSWKNIRFDTAQAFVMAGTNPFLVQGEVTRAQLYDTSYPFSPGKVMVSDTILQNVTLQTHHRSEFEWSIRGTANLLPNTTYYFKQRQLNYRYGCFCSFYSYPQGYPSLTTNSVLPVTLTGFTVADEGKMVTIKWSVAAAENNGYFNIQRSTDGQAWQTITTVKAGDNSSASAAYIAYDNNPPVKGTVYYRLEMYDNTGKASYSDVRFVNLSAAGETVLSVVPNPAHSAISFMLGGTTAKNIQASLTDAFGRMIYRQAFSNMQVNTLYRLNLAQLPARGMYILKITGNGLSESNKVIVQ